MGEGDTIRRAEAGFLLQLPFCGPNLLENFYCNAPQVMKLACTDTCIAELQMVFNSEVILIILFVILIISCTIILLKIRTCITEGKRKALSTCGIQITIKFPMDKVVFIVYTVVIPMLNPMIYTLRKTEMKKAIRRTLDRIFLSGGIQKPVQPEDPKRTDLMLP
ncbi:PREDICTED: olfactory receptor 4D1-like [Chlamydotis macqueenii]|uniref:olfactory receptor 4D1-like n=1 Tax=Chlamydotis macqueenii TaxID=187382 RepID=UPI000529A4F5|nr:PREDICTED: olfactory receptor 4D1-like [Chlamydotis macqueenii]